MTMGLWIWLLIAPLVLAVISLFQDKGGVHYQQRGDRRDDHVRGDHVRSEPVRDARPQGNAPRADAR